MIRTIFCLTLTLLLCQTLAAQMPDSSMLFLRSPYHTVYHHLYYLQNERYQPAKAAEVFDPAQHSTREASKLAIKLKRILDGQGLAIKLEEIPRDPNYIDTTYVGRQRNRYQLTDKYPEFYLVKQGERWYYSEASAEAINLIYARVFPFGTSRLVDWVTTGQHRFLGMTSRQLLGVLVIILLSLLIYKLTTMLFGVMVRSVMRRFSKEELARKYILPVARPVSLLVVIGFLLVTSPILMLPVSFGQYFIIIQRILLPVFATFVLYRMVDLLALYFTRLASTTATTLDDQLVPLLRKTLKTFVIIIGGLWILSTLNVPIIPLLTGLSLGGLAFALAAQDTLKNFFGSLMIFIDKPFQIGDWVSAGDMDGTVEEVGFRSTRIRTFRDSVQSIPNGKLADMMIDNHGLRVYRRFYTMLAITYDTPAERIQLFTEGLREIVLNHPDTRKDFFNIFLNEFGASSLDVIFYIFFKTPSWHDELRCRHEVMLEVIKLAEHLGIRFAFPTQTLHMETYPDASSLTPQYEPVDGKLKADLTLYLEQRKQAGMRGVP